MVFASRPRPRRRTCPPSSCCLSGSSVFSASAHCPRRSCFSLRLSVRLRSGCDAAFPCPRPRPRLFSAALLPSCLCPPPFEYLQHFLCVSWQVQEPDLRFFFEPTPLPAFCSARHSPHPSSDLSLSFCFAPLSPTLLPPRTPLTPPKYRLSRWSLAPGAQR